MKFIFYLLALFGATSCQKLSQAENQYLQSVCGTRGPQTRRFASALNTGWEISPEQAPWAVLLMMGCSGTLISNRHILSARHCIDISKNFQSFIAANARAYCVGSDLIYEGNISYMTAKFADGNPMLAAVTKIYVFNGCATSYFEDDVMVIEFNGDITPTNTAFPSCIFSDRNERFVGKTPSLMSYGSNNPACDRKEFGLGVLRGINLKVVGNNGKELEMTSLTGGSGLRGGDSGGGIMIRINNQITVVAIASSTNCQRSFAILVSYYYDRICYHTGICR